MKTNNLIKVCGSITKKESMASVTYNILKNTCVAEANFPYSGYYGSVPEQADLNSLFLLYNTLLFFRRSFANCTEYRFVLHGKS